MLKMHTLGEIVHKNEFISEDNIKYIKRSSLKNVSISQNCSLGEIHTKIMKRKFMRIFYIYS